MVLEVFQNKWVRAVGLLGAILIVSAVLYLLSAVLVPLFGNKKKDAAAEDKIAECFPGREIISMMAKDLVTEGGAFHCIAMQQPK